VGDSVQTSDPPLEPHGPLSSYSTFLASRPPSFETYAIEEILSLAHVAPQLPLHIVHLSAVEAIPILRDARRRGINVTAETCFHYLSLAAEQVKDGDTRHKCCPPIREKSNQDGLWQELLRGRPIHSTTDIGADQFVNDTFLRTIVSDHSPCTAGLKLLPSDCGSGDFFSAWGGISSVGLGLPILWTESQKRNNGVTIEDIVRWCSQETAKQVGLETSKGDLKVGFDGDVVVFDDKAEFKVRPPPAPIPLHHPISQTTTGRTKHNAIQKQNHPIPRPHAQGRRQGDLGARKEGFLQRPRVCEGWPIW
jgi:allantoinase